MFGVETTLWSTAVKKAREWYRKTLQPAVQFMVRWHEAEAEMSRQRRASVVDGAQGNGGGGGNRGSVRKPDQGNAEMGVNERSRRETAVDESWKEMADRLVRHQAD